MSSISSIRLHGQCFIYHSIIIFHVLSRGKGLSVNYLYQFVFGTGLAGFFGLFFVFFETLHHGHILDIVSDSYFFLKIIIILLKDIFENEDEEDHQTLTYEDLLSFSYQVAKGMEFLSCKNVSCRL